MRDLIRDVISHCAWSCKSNLIGRF